MPENEIYKFLKENNLTSKDEASFTKEYSDPKKAQELHKFMSENDLTTKDSATFYETYFDPSKKKVQNTPTTSNGLENSSTQELGSSGKTKTVEEFNAKYGTNYTDLKTGQTKVDNAEKGVLVPFSPIKVKQPSGEKDFIAPKVQLPDLTKAPMKRYEKAYDGITGRIDNNTKEFDKVTAEAEKQGKELEGTVNKYNNELKQASTVIQNELKAKYEGLLKAGSISVEDANLKLQEEYKKGYGIAEKQITSKYKPSLDSYTSLLDKRKTLGNSINGDIERAKLLSNSVGIIERNVNAQNVSEYNNLENLTVSGLSMLGSAMSGSLPFFLRFTNNNLAEFAAKNNMPELTKVAFEKQADLEKSELLQKMEAYAKEQAQKGAYFSNKITEKEGTLVDNFSQGNYAQAGKVAGLRFLESIPMMGAAIGMTALTGGTASAIIPGGFMFGSQNYYGEYADRPDMSETDKLNASFVKGSLEMATEMSVMPLLSPLKNLIKTGGKEAAREAVQKTLFSTFKNGYSKLAPYFGWFQEGLSEYANEVGSTITDKILDPKFQDKDWGEVIKEANVRGLEAFGPGAFGGVTLTLPVAINNTINKYQNKKMAREFASELEKIEVDIQNPNLTEAQKDILIARKQEIHGKLNEVFDNDKQETAGATTEQVSALDDINDQQDEVAVALQDETISDESKVAFEEKAKELAEQEKAVLEEIKANEIVNSENKIKVGDKIQWNVFGNEINGEWEIKSQTKTRGGQDAVVLSKEYVESSIDGKSYTKEYADNNNIPYDNTRIVEHIVPIADLTENKTNEEEPNTADNGPSNDVVEPIVEPTEEQIAKDIKDKNFVTFEYKSESEVPEQFKDKISSVGEVNGIKIVKVTLPKVVADYELAKINQLSPTTEKPKGENDEKPTTKKTKTDESPVNEIKNGTNEEGNPMEGFDFNKIIEEAEISPNASQKEIDEINEEAYQKSSFDKKWAKTYKEAKQKITDAYHNAVAERTKWQNKKYKSAGNKAVEVGDELSGGAKKIDAINAKKKADGISRAQKDIDSALKDMKLLGLTKDEIQEAIKPRPTANKANLSPIIQRMIDKIDMAALDPTQRVVLALIGNLNKRSYIEHGGQYSHIEGREKEKGGLKNPDAFKIENNNIKLNFIRKNASPIDQVIMGVMSDMGIENYDIIDLIQKSIAMVENSTNLPDLIKKLKGEVNQEELERHEANQAFREEQAQRLNEDQQEQFNEEVIAKEVLMEPLVFELNDQEIEQVEELGITEETEELTAEQFDALEALLFGEPQPINNNENENEKEVKQGENNVTPKQSSSKENSRQDAERKSALEAKVKEARNAYQAAQSKLTKAKQAAEKAGQEQQANIFGGKPADALLFGTDLRSLNVKVKEIQAEADKAKENLDKAQLALDSFVPSNQVQLEIEAVEPSAIEKGQALGKDKTLPDASIQNTIDNANYTPRRKNSVMVRLPIDFVLDNQEEGFKVQRGQNEIGNRIDKAKEFLSKNPKDLEASDIYIKDSGKDKGKIGFGDGRHRLIAAKELGATHAYFEIPATKEQFDALNYLLSEFGNQKGIAQAELYSTQGDFKVIQTSDNTFLLNKGEDISVVKLNESGGVDNLEVTKNGKKIKSDQSIEQAIQAHLQNINPESNIRNIEKFLGSDNSAELASLQEQLKKAKLTSDKRIIQEKIDILLEKQPKSKQSRFVPQASEGVKQKQQSIIEKLKQAFPNIEIVQDEAQLNEVLAKSGARQMNNNGVVYGAIYNGKIYLNPTAIRLDTPIHEFGHIWLDIAKNKYAEYYNNLINTIKETPYFEEAKLAYPDLTETQQAEEAVVQAIAEKGIEQLEAQDKKGIFRKVFDTIKAMGKAILKGLGIKNDMNFLKATWQDLVNKAAQDILSGKPITYATSEDIANMDIDAYPISIEGGLLDTRRSGVDRFISKLTGKKFEGLIPYLREMFKVGGNYPEVKKLDQKRIGAISEYMKQIEGTIFEFRGIMKAWSKGKTDAEINKAIQAMQVALTKSVDALAMRNIPQEFIPIIIRMRSNVDGFSQLLLDSGFIDPNTELAASISANLGVYMNRSYAAFVDDKWNEMMFPDSKKRTPIMEKIYKDAYNFIRNQYDNFVEVDGELYTLTTDGNGNIIGIIDSMENPVDLSQTELLTKIQKAYNNKEKLTVDEINNILKEFARFNKDNQFGKGGKIGKMDLSLFKKRQDIADPLRAFLGEYTEPQAMYINTMTKMAEYIENQKFLADLRKVGEGKIFFDKPIGDYNIEITGQKEYSPLSGLYTSEQINNALKANNHELLNPDNTLVKIWYGINGFIKFGFTGLSVKSQVRNFGSNIFIGFVNGYYNPYTRVKNDIPNPFKLAWSELNKEGGDELAELAKYGVLESSAIGGELRDIVKLVFKDAYSREFNSPENAFEWFTEKSAEVTSKFLNKAADVYKLGDNVHKIFAYYAELATVKYMFPNKTIEEQKAIAADRFNAVNINYGMVPEVIQYLRKNPIIAAFPTFAAEAVRITYNIPALAMSDIKQGIKSKNQQQISVGVNRLSFFTLGMTAVSLIPYFVGKSVGADDDDEQLIRATSPDYAKNTPKVIVAKKDGTNYEVMDLSWQNPLNMPQVAYTSFKNSNESALKSFTTSTLEVLKPFISSEISTKIIVDVATNDNGSGFKIYNKEDNFWNQTKSISDYIYTQARPGIVKEITNIYKGATDREEFGRKYDLASELKQTATGTKIYNIDAVKKLSSMSYKYQSIFEQDYKLYGSVKSEKSNTPDYTERVEKAYEKANKRYAERQQEVINYIQLLQKKGVPDIEIYEKIKSIGGPYNRNLAKKLIYGQIDQFEK